MHPFDAPAPVLDDVRVLRMDINTHYVLKIHPARVAAFYQQILEDRQVCRPEPSEAISGLAGLGLSCIFPQIPQRFPAMDLLMFLRNEQKSYCPGGYPSPTIGLGEIEYHLEKFGMNHKGLAWDGNEL